MVEANAAAQIEVAEMRVVLDEECLLAIVTRLVEEKLRWRAGIEEGLAGPSAAKLGGGDVVRELFVYEAVDRVGSGFHFMVVEVGGDGGADISFTETAVLKYLHGPGICIGSKANFAIADASLHGAENVRGESVLIRDLT
jgi:hypothetical protein